MLVPKNADDVDMPVIDYDRENPCMDEGNFFPTIEDCRNALATYCIKTKIPDIDMPTQIFQTKCQTSIYCSHITTTQITNHYIACTRKVNTSLQHTNLPHFKLNACNYISSQRKARKLKS
jgi:hypothetical protein